MMDKNNLSLKNEIIQYLINSDPNFIFLYNQIGAIKILLNHDPFQFIIETIINQMLSNKVSDIISSRLKNLCYNNKISKDAIKKLSFEEIRSIGISQRKVQCITDFTNIYSKKEFSKKRFSTLSDDEIIKIITSIKGLGIWSAKMFLIFVLGRENIIPLEDMAYLQSFMWYNNYDNYDTVPTKKEILEISNKWIPYNSIVARYFYKALDTGLTKKAFESYILNNNYARNIC
jgi:DNA-3-methyladenine glycosylase II